MEAENALNNKNYEIAEKNYMKAKEQIKILSEITKKSVFSEKE